MNLSMVISVYASISRGLGLPLRFPGTPTAYTALYQVTSADILARATERATTSESAANEIFNVTNSSPKGMLRSFGAPATPPLGSGSPQTITGAAVDDQV